MLKLNIYIVEDNELMAAALKHMLISLGHRVCGSSATYQKAVDELHVMAVDLVITDIMITGEKNGIDLGHYIKTHLKIPFIYLSSITSSKMIKAALDNLPDDYLFKPISKITLAEAITNFQNKKEIEISINKNLSAYYPRF